MSVKLKLSLLKSSQVIFKKFWNIFWEVRVTLAQVCAHVNDLCQRLPKMCSGENRIGEILIGCYSSFCGQMLEKRPPKQS